MTAAFLDTLRVEPGGAPGLARRDPAARPDSVDKAAGVERLHELTERLGALQARLAAEAKRAVLLVLQGADAERLDPRFPPPDPALDGVTVE